MSSFFACAQCGEARDSQYACRDGAASERICPRGESDPPCWWVASGNPYSGRGVGCICLVPVEHWTRA